MRVVALISVAEKLIDSKFVSPKLVCGNNKVNDLSNKTYHEPHYLKNLPQDLLGVPKER